MKQFQVRFDLRAPSAAEAEAIVARMASLAADSGERNFDNFSLSLYDEHGNFVVGHGQLVSAGGDSWTVRREGEK